MQLSDTITVRNNISIVVRERGKIVARHESHNVWLNLGREYLASLICYASFSPLTTERDDRVRYMGFGVGGTKQSSLGVANSAPIVTAYPGPNLQTDTLTTVTSLERPVRISGGSTAYPGVGGDVWMGQVQAPVVHSSPLPTTATFSVLLAETDISYSPFLSVPLSEVGLFTNAVSPNVYNNTAVAYDTFGTITKTAAVEFQINWSVRF